jgi:hypothetical protein
MTAINYDGLRAGYFASLPLRNEYLRSEDDHEELGEEDEGEDEWASRGNFSCHDLTVFPYGFNPHCEPSGEDEGHGTIGGSCYTHEPWNSELVPHGPQRLGYLR